MQDHQGTVGSDAPQHFLTAAERKAVSSATQPFRVSLYKALLFGHVAQGLKAGTVYLEQSYKYRALEGYLLEREQWQTRRTHYVHLADLERLADPHNMLQQLEVDLHQQYVTTNARLEARSNPFVQSKSDETLLVRTPPQRRDHTETLATFFPGRQYIALTEILATVNQLTHFLAEFTHGQHHPTVARPPVQTFLAGLLGVGCGIGIRKLARIFRHVQETQVEHAVNWYFTPTNLQAANDRIPQMIDRLPLPTIYRRSVDSLQTSSDGQKFEIPAESLNANYSSKYFGKGQGVSVYSFMDERHLLFYSTVIRAAERESAYVLEGLLHNNVVHSEVHSTDTHGYSELVFGVMHLLGFTYAPRIKHFQRQRLYAFKGLRRHDAYPSFLVKPSGTINVPLILAQWDAILRLLVSLKLKVTTPSALFRRLNSYSSQYGLYRALKAFGQILKSLFLLRYLDDVELRQRITQQLNKVEQSHRFARALSVGHPRELLSVDKEGQEIEEGCRRLIKNAVTCWNYVYLAKRLLGTADPTHQHLLVQAIRHGSPISWQHINLLGEYDFSDKRLEDSVGILPATWLHAKASKLAELVG
ncbi:MAG: Tn3 family transposase [Nitrospirales bacterium]|nr:Tn3 family transposase [Nitrospira sp.]MDR4502894.1 Tn3 family transposase [Nitrospirales bacterium]